MGWIGWGQSPEQADILSLAMRESMNLKMLPWQGEIHHHHCLAIKAF
jgi:hypothetical protein